MQVSFEYLYPILISIAGIIIFSLIGRFIFKNLNFELGKGIYFGAMPQLGAIIMLFIFCKDLAIDKTTLLLSISALTITGLAADLKKISNNSFMAISLIILASGFYQNSPNQFLSLTVWTAIIFVCLKIAALVYEMPFILTATSSLTMIIILTRDQGNSAELTLIWSVMLCSLSYLFFSIIKDRALTGKSGLMLFSYIIGQVSFLENSGKLIFFALLLPSMVIIFPFALVSIMLIFSYFGNKLHTPEKSQSLFKWGVEREKIIVFSGIFFLCINLFGILKEVNAPNYGYIALVLLLLTAFYGFLKNFARRQQSSSTRVSNRSVILNTPVDAITTDEVLQRIKNHLASGGKGMMHIITADSLALLRCVEDNRFKMVLNRAELIVPDGAGIIWASDFTGQRLPERIPGVGLVSRVCHLSQSQGFKVFFLGGKPGIAQKAADKLLVSYPEMKIAGMHHGYFELESPEEEKIMKSIAASNADIVFVALGVPRQEWFISRFRLFNHKSVVIGVGGSFDVISDTLPRAPVWMQRFALEWLFRLWLEPFRISRILKIPVFVLQVLRQKWNN
jgi:N-acetylglucosaminyldiphosphoundecaprenol N-acetyl-beta-D-mannosaminyltransferase